MNRTKSEIFPLTGLRFIAALYVFLFHMQLRWPIAHHGLGKNLLDQGAVGMTIFFVLSGFVLAYSYRDTKISAHDYLVNRFARIYPLYIAAALLTLPWIGITLIGSGAIDKLKYAAQFVLLMFVNLFMVQAWLPSLFSFWNFGGSWSISVEAFCYLLIPVLLRIFSSLTSKQIRWIAAACLILGSLPGLAATLFSYPITIDFYCLPIFRLPEFTLGICLCYLQRSDARPVRQTLLQIASIVIFVVCLRFAGHIFPFQQLGLHWIALPTIALLIFTLSQGKGLFAAILSSRLFMWLGHISYCFYSFQSFVLLVLISNHDPLVQFFPKLENNRLLALLVFFILIALSAIGHHLIEEPMRKWLRRKYHERAHGVLQSQRSCSPRLDA